MKLKSKKLLLRIFLINSAITLFLSLIIYLFNIPWHTLDYRAADRLYATALDNGKGPGINNRIVYLNISDKSLNAFGSSFLNRKSLSEVNNFLSALNPEAVFFDIIFPRPSKPEEDSLFAESIGDITAYLPAGFQLSDQPSRFRWEEGAFFHRLKNEYTAPLKTTGEGNPYSAVWGLAQKDEFALAAANSGHISIVRDNDGILRHFPLIIKIDSLYFPGISLAMFLDYNRIPFEKLVVNWGESLVIPALPESFLEKDIVIPIDEHGNLFIPYQGRWSDRSIKSLEAHSFLRYSQEPELLDELLEDFEGNFVLISDISVGTSDLGQTTIEENVPLITVHSAILNSLLNNTFYSVWKPLSLAVFIIPAGLLIGFSAFPKSNFLFYLTGPLIIAVIAVYSYYMMVNHNLFPFVTGAGAAALIYIGMIISMNVIVSRDQAFIKNAFSKYVPNKVIDQLIEKPELLKLGGEERILTILFSDLEGFTSISEVMKPSDLVHLLNEYLTEMTSLIIRGGGIIDKYIGDAILAEFGAPIQLPNHADAAVSTALYMQKKLKDLNSGWLEKGYPEIKSRVGINTGNVILGNMGSEQVFDYTVIGDPVNLAARLESANKLYSTNIMLSEYTFAELTPGTFRSRLLDIIKVKGKSRAVKVYEIFGFSSDDITGDVSDYFQNYDKAFNLYLEKNFPESEEYFKKALLLRPDDYLSGRMIERIGVYKNMTLEEDWDGSVKLREK